MRRRLAFYVTVTLISLTTNSATADTWTPTSWGQQTYCPSQSLQQSQVQYYASPLSSRPSATVNASGYSLDIYEVKTATRSYGYEATRWYSSQGTCDYCPYDLDSVASDEWQTSDTVAVDPSSTLLDQTYYTETRKRMYGPCLTGLAGMPATCVQHPAFFPPQILGEYYFPKQDDQNVDIAGLMHTRHQFLLPEAPTGSKLSGGTTPKLPTWYGMGKAAVQDTLSSFSVNWVKTNTIDETATSLARAPFAGNNWTMWAQMFCTPGCHRDAAYTLRGFASMADYANNTRYNYLSRFFPNATSAMDRQAVTSCRPCPPRTAVAAPFVTTDEPHSKHPKMAPMATDCIPWFGGIPSINYDSATQSNYIPFTMTALPAYVGFPSTVKEYISTACPVNTYNRKCAYDKLKDFEDDVPSAYGCDPCPAGWSTNGSTGAWFCLPPPGRMFAAAVISALKAVPVTNYQQPSTTTIVNGSQWRNRNLWAYELECGTIETDCRQCQALDLLLRPWEFNEQMIFANFFKTSPCTSNFYCPDALTVLPCNASFPYSPPGSSSPSNCTCRRGTYLDAATRACKTCTQSSACGPSQYLPASKCVAKDGATQDALCLPCTNINSATMIPVSGNAGPDASSAPPGAVENATATGGLCSFRCITGYVLYGRTEPFSCVPKTFIDTSTKMQVWNPAVQYNFDWVLYTSGSSISKTYLYLTNLQLVGTAGQWVNDTRSCQLSANGVPSYMGPYRGYNYTECIPCNHAAPPANGGSFVVAGGGTPDVSVCTQVKCQANTLYINYSSWACESCSAFGQKHCPAGTYVYGQGCLDDQTLFNMVNPASNCRACDKSEAEAGHTGQYLSMDVASPSTFCTWQTCPPALGPNYWPNPPCGGSVRGHWELCANMTSACAANFYVSGSNPTCGNTANWICAACTTNAAPGETQHNATPCLISSFIHVCLECLGAWQDGTYRRRATPRAGPTQHRQFVRRTTSARERPPSRRRALTPICRPSAPERPHGATASAAWGTCSTQRTPTAASPSQDATAARPSRLLDLASRRPTTWTSSWTLASGMSPSAYHAPHP